MTELEHLTNVLVNGILFRNLIDPHWPWCDSEDCGACANDKDVRALLKRTFKAGRDLKPTDQEIETAVMNVEPG